jgi:hypothetical protein
LAFSTPKRNPALGSFIYARPLATNASRWAVRTKVGQKWHTRAVRLICDNRAYANYLFSPKNNFLLPQLPPAKLIEKQWTIYQPFLVTNILDALLEVWEIVQKQLVENM